MEVKRRHEGILLKISRNRITGGKVDREETAGEGMRECTLSRFVYGGRLCMGSGVQSGCIGVGKIKGRELGMGSGVIS